MHSNHRHQGLQLGSRKKCRNGCQKQTIELLKHALKRNFKYIAICLNVCTGLNLILCRSTTLNFHVSGSKSLTTEINFIALLRQLGFSDLSEILLRKIES